MQDKTDDVKKSKKEEENGEGDNFEEILDEEEEEVEGEEDEEDQLSEADELGDELGEGEGIYIRLFIVIQPFLAVLRVYSENAQ